MQPGGAGLAVGPAESGRRVPEHLGRLAAGRAGHRLDRGSHLAERGAQGALGHLWGAYMAQAHAGRSSRQAGQRFTSLDVLREAAQIRITDELRNEAIASLALVDVRAVRRFAKIEHEDDGVAVDPALERYALGDSEGNVSVNRVADGREISGYPGAMARAGTSSSAPTAAI